MSTSYAANRSSWPIHAIIAPLSVHKCVGAVKSGIWYLLDS